MRCHAMMECLDYLGHCAFISEQGLVTTQSTLAFRLGSPRRLQSMAGRLISFALSTISESNLKTPEVQKACKYKNKKKRRDKRETKNFPGDKQD